LREKVLAAQRAGVKKVVMPRENEPELSELPEETRDELEFVPVDSIEEVLDVAFDGAESVSRPAEITRGRKAASSR
jgi:ATP-dependent Lon protease